MGITAKVVHEQLIQGHQFATFKCELVLKEQIEIRYNWNCASFIFLITIHCEINKTNQEKFSTTGLETDHLVLHVINIPLYQQ